MLLRPTCVLTAVLATTVSATTATTVLPHLAFHHGLRSITASPFTGQAVMGVHAPAYAVMLPNWQESEHHLHKRAPIGMDKVDEEGDLEKRQFLGGLHKIPKPAGSIPDAVVKEFPPKLKELYRIKKKAKDDKNLFNFQKNRSLESYVYAPVRHYRMIAVNAAKNLVGRVVKVFNKTKGNEIVTRTSGMEYTKKLHAEVRKHRKMMETIHTNHGAPKPEVYSWPNQAKELRPTTSS